MLLQDMKKPIRFLIGGLVLLFCLIAGNARAQSGYQLITFSVVGEYESQTNNVPTDPTETNLYLHLVAFTSANVVEAIALDMFSYPAWTNWRYAGLIRRVNFATGDERIYLNRGGTNEVDVSSYLQHDLHQQFHIRAGGGAFPAATNNFTANDPNPLQPLFSGTPTNHFASVGMNFISLTTTNLKMNLLGASFGGLGTHYGVLHKFRGRRRRAVIRARCRTR